MRKSERTNGIKHSPHHNACDIHQLIKSSVSNHSQHLPHICCLKSDTAPVSERPHHHYSHQAPPYPLTQLPSRYSYSKKPVDTQADKHPPDHSPSHLPQRWMAGGHSSVQVAVAFRPNAHCDRRKGSGFLVAGIAEALDQAGDQVAL